MKKVSAHPHHKKEVNFNEWNTLPFLYQRVLMRTLDNAKHQIKKLEENGTRKATC